MGAQLSTPTSDTLIRHAHHHSLTLLEMYRRANKPQKFAVWIAIAVALQRINKRNLIGIHIYMVLSLMSLPVRHLLEVIFEFRNDEQSLMTLTLREQFIHDFLRYSFMWLPVNSQRKMAEQFSALASRLHKSHIDRVFLHETNNPYSRDVYIDWYGGAANITEKTKVILYSHGGAYVFGHSRQYPGAFKHILERLHSQGIADVRLASLNYRLAPEHQAPAPIVDGIEAYDYLIDRVKVPSHNIILSGDSAGGNLSLSLSVQIRDTGRPMPAGVMVYSPWLDGRYTDEPYFDWMFRDYLVRASTENFSEAYFGKRDRANIVCSPGLADMSSVPDTLVWYANKELLAGQVVPWMNDLKEKGVENIKFISNRKLYHIAPLLADLIGDSALDDLNAIVDWMKGCFDKGSAARSENKRPRVKYSKEMMAMLKNP